MYLSKLFKLFYNLKSMSYSDGTQYMEIPDMTEAKSGGLGWLWGLLIFIILVVAIVFLVLWLTERSKTEKELSITGAQFSLTSNNSMQASWSAVGNPDDIVTLYVFKTGTPVKFNSDGTPSATAIATSGPINGNTTKTAVASPTLTSGQAYTGYLIVTNANFPKTHGTPVVSPALVPNSQPSGAFNISATGQPGEIVYDITTVPTKPTVGYNFSNFISLDNNLLHHDPNGLLCTVLLPLHAAVTSTTTCANVGGAYLLYDPTPTSSTNQLGIEPYPQSTPTTPYDPTKDTTAQWTFDTSKNTWCLTANPTKCLQLPNGSSGSTGVINISTSTPTTWYNTNFTFSST